MEVSTILGQTYITGKRVADESVHVYTILQQTCITEILTWYKYEGG